MLTRALLSFSVSIGIVSAQQWTPLQPAHMPTAPLSGAAMAWDAARGGAVLFGGITNDAVYPLVQITVADTWTFDGVDWTRRQPAVHPPARAQHSMAWDGGRHVVVLFGGLDHDGGVLNGTALNDAWEWDGANWATLYQSTGPAPRFQASMAGSNDRGVWVYGGRSTSSGAQPYFGDLWVWNGVTGPNPGWSQGGPAPSPRTGAAMAMTRRGLMIHGGYNAQGAIDETWVRPPLASTFTLLPQGGGPVNSVAVADQDAAQVFAVTLAPPSPEALGLWRFDGQHWFEISRAPYHANSATAAIDPATHRLFVFDGGNLYFQFNGMWVYSSTFPVERIGTPCASVGAPAPQLQVEAPAIGAAMQLVITCTTPFDLGLLVLGFDDQSWNGVPLPLDLGSLGLPGCLARVAPILSRLLPGGSGTVTFLPIAADPALIGSVLFVQAATVTGGALRGVTDTARCTVY